MVDQYWRKIEDVENDIENAMQISGILLKLKGYDNDLEKIEDNENNISSNLGKINSHSSTISSNLKKIDDFTQYILQSGKDFEEKYTIEKQIFRFNKDKHFYTIFEKEIEFDFTKNSLLFVKNNMYYKYENLSNDYYRLQHEYNIYDGENNFIHKYLFNKDTYYDESLDPILHTNEDFCICFKKNYNKIKINLQLHRHNRHGVGNINLEIDDDNENYINVDYVDRNEKVDTNTESISSNLGKINTNVADISSNLGKIDNNINAIKLINKNSQDNSKDISTNKGLISTNTSSIASNLSKINNINIILKNLYTFIPFYDHDDYDGEKNRIPVNRLFFSKTFKMNIKKNDFIEIHLRMFLEYETLDNAHIVDTLIKFFDDDERIYFIKYRNGNFLAYGKYVFLNNNIIYHFEKDTENLKIEIRFEYNSKIFSLGVDKIWHVSRNTTDRWILKHYGGSI